VVCVRRQRMLFPACKLGRGTGCFLPIGCLRETLFRLESPTYLKKATQQFDVSITPGTANLCYNAARPFGLYLNCRSAYFCGMRPLCCETEGFPSFGAISRALLGVHHRRMASPSISNSQTTLQTHRATRAIWTSGTVRPKQHQHHTR